MGDLWVTYGIDGEMIGRFQGGFGEVSGKETGETCAILVQSEQMLYFCGRFDTYVATQTPDNVPKVIRKHPDKRLIMILM